MRFLCIRIFRVSDENMRIRKQYRAIKQAYEEKIQTIESAVSMEKEQKNILQDHVNEYQSATSKVKDDVKVRIYTLSSIRKEFLTVFR